jgi:hypothetical protein
MLQNNIMKNEGWQTALCQLAPMGFITGQTLGMIENYIECREKRYLISNIRMDI